jgi:phage terminase large subunit-like protein
MSQHSQIVIQLIRAELTKRQQYQWLKQARPEQLPPPGNWQTWLILAGRGFGKTRTGAETIRTWVQQGTAQHIALISSSINEARAVMVEGASGLLTIHPPHNRPTYITAKHQLIWPNGARATLYGGASPERLRGPQFDTAWIDELAKFKRAEDLWQQLQLGLRLGHHPRCIITTTPRPIKLLQELVNDPTVYVTRGTTFDNRANLAPNFLTQMERQFSHTRLGAQELYAEILSEHPGALWQRDLICYQNCCPNQLSRIVIAIDPATTHHHHSDETGIVVIGINTDHQIYVLDDLSGRYSPHDWGQRIVKAYWDYKADRVVAETNKGGDLVERMVRTIDPTISYKEVRATRGKYIRAEPIAALYEQKRVFHVRPFRELEHQMCHYIPGETTKSPDRMDALVWGITELILESERRPILKVWGID